MADEKKVGSLYTFTMDTGIGTQLTVNGNFPEDVSATDMIRQIEKLQAVGQHFLRKEEEKNLMSQRAQAKLEIQNITDHLNSIRDKDDTEPHVITQLENTYRGALRKLEGIESKLGQVLNATA